MVVSEAVTDQQIAQWHKDGAVVIEDFFTAAEIAPIYADYQAQYGVQGQGDGKALDVKPAGSVGASHRKQFMNVDILPYQGSVAMNMISLNPRLIALAKRMLGVNEVELYQSHTWAKFTGEADYDQAFHCDFGNHTLTVPGDEAQSRTVNFVIYISDVTDGVGALHYVAKDDAAAVLGDGAIVASTEQQPALLARQRSASAPAGSILAYGIDTFHRGTNLTDLDGFRYTMTVSYKAVGNSQIGFHVWQFAPDRPWYLILNHGSPQQLQCLGIPLPGDPFWTKRTLQLTQERWPDWDMSVYIAAAE
ncbi:MAG: hypothetical protein CMP86_01300 [Gammaproteobacteria bacterium]|jgi:ectoine hydroxylase-related dioxygenase (phytanoyl-CoA dioxygenase family)|nr:hypothetical protein [Gammaproteobacteria bacterium]